MDGIGSGRPGGIGRETVESFRSVDINRLHQEGCLSPRWTGVWQWTHDGERLAWINMHMESERLVLSYCHRVSGGDWQGITEPVLREFSPHPWWGVRRGNDMLSIISLTQLTPLTYLIFASL